MNCRDVDRLLMRGEISSAAQLPLEAREHIAVCPSCQALARALSPEEAAEPLPTEMLRGLERKLTKDLRPVRPLSPAPYRFAVFAGTFVAVVIFGVARLGALAIPVLSPAQAAVSLTVLAAGATLLAYSLAQQMVPGSRLLWNPAVLPVTITIALIVAIAGMFPFQREPNFWGNAWICLRTGAVLAAVTAAPVWMLLRRGAILSPRLTGAAAGLLAGLAGTSALAIHCPNLNAAHILAGHVGVALLGATAGLGVGYAIETYGFHHAKSDRA